ncbi:MAG TPA: DUF4291 domain-containing protein [Ktedonobacteraceae bacterium]|nr:DUF4291 domain-containing protein [Ktedonobacteraceae bacterium]
MQLITEPYLSQLARWPTEGRHILAQYDDDSIIVYQAYRPAIGHFAAQHGYFGHGFSFERMTWLKPNFLWMQHRSGWSRKEKQEVTLAVRLKRAAFDTILAQAMHSTYVSAVYQSEEAWKQAVETSSVRLQWDPDHAPDGSKLERRAIQLGLRGPVLAQYAREWIIDIEDITDFVHQQHEQVKAQNYAQFATPREMVYPVNDTIVAQKLGFSVYP